MPGVTVIAEGQFLARGNGVGIETEMNVLQIFLFLFRVTTGTVDIDLPLPEMDGGAGMHMTVGAGHSLFLMDIPHPEGLIDEQRPGFSIRGDLGYLRFSMTLKAILITEALAGDKAQAHQKQDQNQERTFFNNHECER